MATKTVLDFGAITSVLGTDITYLVRGTGTTRDKQITLTEFFNTIPEASILDGNFYLKDSDVVHGMTTLAPTNSYGTLSAISGTAGGLKIQGLSDTDIAALNLYGIIGSTNPTDTIPAVSLIGGKADGAAGWQALGASETVFQVSNYTTALMTVLGDGKVGLSVASSLGAGLDVESTLTGNRNAKFGAVLPVYILSNPGGIFFNSYWDGTNHRYGKGSSSNYAQAIAAGISDGSINFYTSPTAGNADAIISDLTNRMIITKDGKVGINKSSSLLAQLHVETGTSVVSGMFGTSTDQNGIYFVNSGINSSYGYNGEATLYLSYAGYQNGYTQFRDTIIGNGKAGIIATFDGSANAFNIASGGVMQHNGTSVLGYEATGNSAVFLRYLDVTLTAAATVVVANITSPAVPISYVGIYKLSGTPTSTRFFIPLIQIDTGGVVYIGVRCTDTSHATASPGSDIVFRIYFYTAS